MKNSHMGPLRGQSRIKTTKTSAKEIAQDIDDFSVVDKVDGGRVRKIMSLIENELREAATGHEKFHSSHEGFAVILEEVDELWDEIKKKAKNRSDKRMLEEAVQIGAMAARFIHDLL